MQLNQIIGKIFQLPPQNQKPPFTVYFRRTLVYIYPEYKLINSKFMSSPKRNFYIFCTVVLCLLINFIFFSVTVTSYLQNVLEYRMTAQSNLLIGLYAALLFSLGILEGLSLGRAWWQIVYVEKKHWRNWFNKKKINDKKKSAPVAGGRRRVK